MLRRCVWPGAAMVAALLMAFSAGGCGSQPAATTDTGGGGGTTTGATTAASSAPARTVLESGGFELTSKSANYCTAQAPADWAMTASQASDNADLVSADRSMGAGYGIQAINTALAPYAGAYNPPLNNPDLYSSDAGTAVRAWVEIALASVGTPGRLRWTGQYDQTIGDYTLRSASMGGLTGVIFYRTQGFPIDAAQYAEPYYTAFTTSAKWQSEGLLVARIAASIRCTTQLQPRDQYVVTPGDSGGSTGADENGSDPGYNPQLGTEYAHDSLGNNYLVSPSDNWSPTGPDGDGYYVSKSGGNDYERLLPGRSD